MSADAELEDDDNVDVDAELRRVDMYASTAGVDHEDENTEEAEASVNAKIDDEDYEEEDDEDEDEEDEDEEDDEDEDEDYEEEDDEDEDEEDDEEDEDENEEVASTVEDNEEESDDSEDFNTMADKKISLSDHVRREIERRQKSGDSLRGVEIVSALEKRGISVSAAQVSQLLKKAGVPPGKKGRKKAAATDTGDEKSRVAPRVNGKKTLPKRKTGQPATRRDEKSAAAETPVAGRVRPAPASAGASREKLLTHASEFFAVCGHDEDTAFRLLRAASAIHNALDVND